MDNVSIIGIDCPSSKQMGLLSVFHKGGSGSSLFDVKPLGFDGSSGGFGWSVFDLFSLFDDGGVASKVGVGWSYVADALVVALVVVVIDEGADLVFEIAGEIIIFKQDRHLPRCFASRNASATRSSAGPSYGLPGQPPTLGLPHPRGNAVHGAEAGTVLEQEACPEAGPVERPGEQPRHRGGRHFHGRRRALAGPAPARTADHALVGLDLDLDEGGFLGAVRRIGLPAPAADARIRRRVVLFGALIEPGPLGAAVAGRAALLAALVFRARLVLLLALAAVERPRQHRPGRTKPLKLDFQRLDPVPRRLRALAQAGVLPGQRLDRSLLAPRPSQSPAEIGVCNGQRLRQRLPAHTVTASRAARAPAPTRGTTGPRHYPRPASSRCQNPRPEPPCARR